MDDFDIAKPYIDKYKWKHGKLIPQKGFSAVFFVFLKKYGKKWEFYSQVLQTDKFFGINIL